MNFLNSAEFAMPISLSHLKYLGIPKGVMIVAFTASINSEVFLEVIALSWMYPVNISTAKNIVVLPFLVGVREGIKSTAQLVLGALTISIDLKICGCGAVALNWHCMHESVKFLK